ncbi:MAG: hypothetical protein AABX44_00795 [Nanoarchaeota archaeon]
MEINTKTKIKSTKFNYLIQNFVENLSKKQLLILLGTMPLGFILGGAVHALFDKTKANFNKYNTETFSIIDSLSMDTIFRKRGEFYADTLVDYHKLLKKDIKFKTFENLESEGYLFIRDKEIFSYKSLENNLLSNEIFGQKNETKTYLITGDFFGEDFELNKLELTKYKINSDLLDDSFNLNTSSHQKNVISEVYTRETDLGNKVLDNEQANVREYLNKILEHKKSLKD